jgi:hypothetical protein
MIFPVFATNRSLDPMRQHPSIKGLLFLFREILFYSDRLHQFETPDHPVRPVQQLGFRTDIYNIEFHGRTWPPHLNQVQTTPLRGRGFTITP